MAMVKDRPLARAFGPINFAPIYASAGRYGEADDMLQRIPAESAPPGMVEAATHLLRTAPAKAASPQTLPRLGILGWVYFYVGAPDRVLEFYERDVEAGYNFGLDATFLWYPSFAPIRKTERFKAFVRKAGYVDIGAPRAGRICATPPPATISPAIETIAPKN